MPRETRPQLNVLCFPFVREPRLWKYYQLKAVPWPRPHLILVSRSSWLRSIDRLPSADKHAIRPFPVNVRKRNLPNCIGEKSMAKLAYHKETAALLVIDPYNDFISEGGKIWDRLKAVAEANQCVPNML